ncbi:MAG: 6-bladed beta-propeller [Bacteroidota bacterium]
MSKSNSRRNFLTSAGLTTLGLACGTPVAPVTETPPEPAPARRNRIGQGDFTYAVDKRWGEQNPEQYPVMHCHEMVMDHQGRLILLTTDRRNNILVYNKDGKVTNSWTHDLPEAHGLTIAGEGSDQSLWITDCTAGRVLNVSLDGRIIRELVLPSGIIPADKEYKPTETAISPNGDIYVADGYGSNLILHYDSLGRLKHHFGGPEHFDCAHGIALDSRTAEPTLLITSRTGNNFQRWTLGGEHLQTYETPGLWLCRPVIDGEHTYFAVIVTKDWWKYDGMIAVLDKDMKVVSLPGGSPPPASQDFREVGYDDTFLNPHDVCVDEDGNLYVPQWNSGRTYPIRLKRS